MKHCKNCGGQVEDDDIYCGYCGSKIIDEPHNDDSNLQDFKEEEFGGADFIDEFDIDFNTQQDVKRNVERETYVERGGRSTTYSSTNNNGNYQDRKRNSANKDARDAKTYGILALVFGIFGGFLGIIFGIMGIQKANKALKFDYEDSGFKKKARDGRVMSIIGIVLSALSIISFFIF